VEIREEVRQLAEPLAEESGFELVESEIAPGSAGDCRIALT
jgi:hypothetical protein